MSISARGQIDPESRELLQMGYNQPVEGRGPIAGYAYYYLNHPSFYRSNLTLRLAVAPVYMDSELGFKGALGNNTDLGVGVAGGGFADGYSEVRGGKLLREESFVGHGGEVSGSIYHLFNPGSQIPVNGIIRGAVHYSAFDKDSRTASNFLLPEDRTTVHLRTGVRWGGREPLVFPEMAMELSAWYDGQFRTGSGTYGYAGDREVNSVSHLFWGRALLAYTFPECKHYFSVSLTTGASIRPDRFSAYRIGGSLPLVAEFPLSLPGYYFQELSAERFALFNGLYSLPVDPSGHWEIMSYAATTVMKPLRGWDTTTSWHSGVGGAVVFRPGSKAWQFVLGYGYGIDAVRSQGRGAQSVGLLIQYDFEQGGPLLRQGINPMRWSGFERLFGR